MIKISSLVRKTTLDELPQLINVLKREMRRVIFKLLDIIKGRPLQKQLDDLSSFAEKRYNLKEFLSFQEERLNNIISYSISNVPFYKNFPKDILKLPVLNKSNFRNNLSEFISDKFEIKQLKEVVTSGSTGIPFKVFLSKVKITRNTADTIKFGELGGFYIGTPLAYFKIWNNVNNKSMLMQIAQNIFPLNVHNLSDQRIEKMINQFNSKSNLSFLGYASALESISDSVRRCNLKVKVKLDSIITMSEGISLEGRKRIQSTFNCSVYARYSNVENGIIAQQTSMKSDRYLINSSSYYVEILNFDKDCPVEDGHIGRIVITDYFNTGMPMIRYDTGDIGSKIVVREDEKVKEYLIDVGGRKMDAIYNTQGELVSSFVITNGMWNYPELLQYQFIQKSSNKYIFKLNCPNGFIRQEELKKDITSVLGSDANICFEYVNEIPVLLSGKRKKVVNLMNK